MNTSRENPLSSTPFERVDDSIYDADDNLVCTWVRKKNADLICNAVNNHRALIRVLGESLELLRDSVNYDEGDKDYHRTIRAGWKAIDKMKGGQR